jgi:hypothetical protein
MTQDVSQDYSLTRDFMNRRLQDVAFIGQTTGQVKMLAEFGARSLASYMGVIFKYYFL